jgi:ribonucleotide reductase beta subunit family protein with ferritin-like domain
LNILLKKNELTYAKKANPNTIKIYGPGFKNPTKSTHKRVHIKMNIVFLMFVNAINSAFLRVCFTVFLNLDRRGKLNNNIKQYKTLMKDIINPKIFPTKVSIENQKLREKIKTLPMMNKSIHIIVDCIKFSLKDLKKLR